MNKSDMDNARGDNAAAGAGTSIVNSVDQMVKLPLQMTGATWDFMMQRMRNMTGTGRQPQTTESNSRMSPDQSQSPREGDGVNADDLGGDDLKYVTWSIIFTKPGFECVLEPQRAELLNYSADVSSFAAVKIAKLLDQARHGHAEKAESWRDQNYPPDYSRTESRADAPADPSTGNDRGWRIPPDDQKYIMFLHRVEWRLPKQEEVTRVERVTIERGNTSRIA